MTPGLNNTSPPPMCPQMKCSFASLECTDLKNSHEVFSPEKF